MTLQSLEYGTKSKQRKEKRAEREERFFFMEI
jgi:hypothetical protein